MDILFYLGNILSDFRHLFNPQNLALFQAFIKSSVTNPTALALGCRSGGWGVYQKIDLTFTI